MIILTNSLAKKTDEGSLKTADSIIRRIKRMCPATKVITFERETDISDESVRANKLLLNRGLASRVRKKSVLYVPFPARPIATALRIFVLSRFTGRNLKVLLVMCSPMDSLSKWLLKLSGAELIVISRSALEYYRIFLGDRVHYLKLGVDTVRFCPVEDRRKMELRDKYGIPRDKKVVLHVGHLNAGRNVGTLLSVAPEFHTVLVVSTQTADQQDRQLRSRLLAKENMTLLDSYLPDIQELYQLADIYLFPVQNPESCIDAPLSALEAAACGIPVVATLYGELKELLSQDGFYPLEDMEPEALNELLRKVAAQSRSPRESVLEYDWNHAAEIILQIIMRK